jgi:hypothetical protein
VRLSLTAAQSRQRDSTPRMIMRSSCTVHNTTQYVRREKYLDPPQITCAWSFGPLYGFVPLWGRDAFGVCSEVLGYAGG